MICEVARSNEADIEFALDAAHAAKDAWGRTSQAERAVMLNKIADIMEDNLDLLAEAETWDNGKPIRETTAADMPLAIDHFRYLRASSVRKKVQSLKLTMTRWLITSMSLWVLLGKSSRGTSRF